MKKFNADGPEYSLFDFAQGTAELSLSEGSAPQGGAVMLPWDAAVASRGAPIAPYRTTGKRALDVLLVLMSLPFTLPVIALCALALWLEGGSPFYTQQRVGRKGRTFSILKLRTMVRDADAALARILAEDPEMRAEWDSLQKLKNDPRITPVGAFLRATSLVKHRYQPGNFDDLPRFHRYRGQIRKIIELGKRSVVERMFVDLIQPIFHGGVVRFN